MSKSMRCKSCRKFICGCPIKPALLQAPQVINSVVSQYGDIEPDKITKIIQILFKTTINKAQTTTLSVLDHQPNDSNWSESENDYSGYESNQSSSAMSTGSLASKSIYSESECEEKDILETPKAAKKKTADKKKRRQQNIPLEMHGYRGFYVGFNMRPHPVVFLQYRYGGTVQKKFHSAIVAHQILRCLREVGYVPAELGKDELSCFISLMDMGGIVKAFGTLISNWITLYDSRIGEIRQFSEFYTHYVLL